MRRDQRRDGPAEPAGPAKTVLDRNSSSSQPRNRGSGRSSAGTRLLVLTCTRSVYGNQ